MEYTKKQIYSMIEPVRGNKVEKKWYKNKVMIGLILGVIVVCGFGIYTNRGSLQDQVPSFIDIIKNFHESSRATTNFYPSNGSVIEKLPPILRQSVSPPLGLNI